MRSKHRQSVFVKEDSALQNVICLIVLIRTNLVVACDDHAETFINSNTPPVPDDTECLRSIAQCLSLSLPPGHYAVCGDCASFYTCDPPRLTAALLQCPSTLLFDPKIGVCNHRYAVNCASDGEPKATTQLRSPLIKSGAATTRPAKDASTSLWSEPSMLLSAESVSRGPLRNLPAASLLTTTPTTSFASFAPVSTVMGRESRPLAKTTDAASLEDNFVSHVQAIEAASAATETRSSSIKHVTVPGVFPEKTPFPSGFLPDAKLFPGQMDGFPLRAGSSDETFSPTVNMFAAKDATPNKIQFSTTEQLSTAATETESTSVKTVLSTMPSSVEALAKYTKAELQSSVIPQSKQTIITSSALSSLSLSHSTNLLASTSFLVTSPPSSPTELEVSSVDSVTSSSLPKSASLDTEATLSAPPALLDGSGKNSTTSADSASSVPLAVLSLTDSSPFSRTLQASAAELSSSSISSLSLSALPSSSSSSSSTSPSSQALSSPLSTLSSSLPLLSSTSSSSSQRSGLVSRKTEPAEIIDAAIEELPGLLRRVTCWKSSGPSDQCRAASEACLAA